MLPYLIIGQGLAGSFIALELLKRNIPCQIFDAGHAHSASRLAAGLWNPVSFKRITAHEFVHPYLAALKEHWRIWTPYLGDEFLHDIPIFRVFPDQAYANDWDVKSDMPKMKELLQTPIAKSPPWKMPFGAGVVQKAGWLNVPLYLQAVRNYLQTTGSYHAKEILWDQVKFHPDYLTYQGQSFQKMIVCVGLFEQHPALSKINIIPNKGHLLEIETAEIPQDNITHYGHFCVPIGAGKFRIGSSYEWENSSEQLAPSIVNELLENFIEHSGVNPTFKNAYVGHRPTVKDRNPIIGCLKNQPLIAIFNGLGTKGVLQGPFLAQLLADHLIDQKDIPKNFSVSRFSQQ